jgi:hypothetical protein
MIAIGNHCGKDVDSYSFSNTCQIDTFYWKFQIIEYRFEQIYHRMIKRQAVKKIICHVFCCIISIFNQISK